MKLWIQRFCAGILILCMIATFMPMGVQAALVEDASPYLTQQMLLGDDLTFLLQGNVLRSSFGARTVDCRILHRAYCR